MPMRMSGSADVLPRRQGRKLEGQLRGLLATPGGAFNMMRAGASRTVDAGRQSEGPGTWSGE
jgi:hypothetical protein